MSTIIFSASVLGAADKECTKPAAEKIVLLKLYA
jgi:hypothetical protein